jgi:hypothetical protein
VANPGVSFDSALRRGKALFNRLHGRKWHTSLIALMVDDRDWVMAESSGELQWHFMVTGGSVKDETAFVRDPGGNLLAADLADAWSIAYLCGGMLESAAKVGRDISPYRSAWTHLVVLQNWVVESVRADPNVAHIPILRKTRFRRASLENLRIEFGYDFQSIPSLDFSHPHEGWLRAGMMLGGIPHIADEKGYIRDQVLPGKSLVASVSLVDEKGRPVPSVPRSRPSPCGLCWADSSLGGVGKCPSNCIYGDSGSLSGPQEFRYSTERPNSPATRGPDVAHRLYGAYEKVGKGTVPERAEYRELRMWLRNKAAGIHGGKPPINTDQLKEMILRTAKAHTPRWGAGSPGPHSDLEMLEAYRAQHPDQVSPSKVTIATVGRVRRTLGYHWRKGRLVLPSNANRLETPLSD